VDFSTVRAIDLAIDFLFDRELTTAHKLTAAQNFDTARTGRVSPDSHSDFAKTMVKHL
jgi:hypothetical protein